MFNFHGAGGMGGMGGMGGGEPANTTAFYETLGVAKTADAKDIKRAYRKAAMKHHPDKGGDAEKFKEITKAYEVLQDPDKRELYDKYGEKGLEGGGGGGAEDIFSSMFGGGGRGGRRGTRQRKGKDVLFRLKVTLEDLYNGATKKLRLKKQVVCAPCKGKGGSNVVTCTACRGQGVQMKVRQIGPGMLQQVQVACSSCAGQGETVGEKCKVCRGAKTKKTTKTLEVHVEKGMKNGSKITFRQESDEAPGVIAGDVIVALEVEEHPHFKREGNQLFFTKTISLREALTGASVRLQQLDKRVLVAASEGNGVISPGQIMCIKDEGMPLKSNPTQRGNLYIEFKIKFPTASELKEGSAKTLKKVLPAPLLGKEDTDDMEDCFLESVDMEMEQRIWKDEARRAKGGSEQYDDDEDEGHGHGPQAQQCQAQ